MLELGILASADAQNGFRNRRAPSTESHRTARSCHWRNGQTSFGTSRGREPFGASRCPQAVCEPGTEPPSLRKVSKGHNQSSNCPRRPHLQNCASRVPFQKRRGVPGPAFGFAVGNAGDPGAPASVFAGAGIPPAQTQPAAPQSAGETRRFPAEPGARSPEPGAERTGSQQKRLWTGLKLSNTATTFTRSSEQDLLLSVLTRSI